LISVLSPIPLY